MLDVVQVGTFRKFQVRWADGYPTSWEPEENVPQSLIALFRQQNPELFEEKTRLEEGVDLAALGTSEYNTQYILDENGANGGSSSSSDAKGPSRRKNQQQPVASAS